MESKQLDKPSTNEITDSEELHSWQRKCMRLLCKHNNIILFEYLVSENVLIFTRYPPDGTPTDFVLPDFTEKITLPTAQNRDNVTLFRNVFEHLKETNNSSQFECRINFPTAIRPTAAEDSSDSSPSLVFEEGPRWWHISLASVDEGPQGFHGVVGVASDIQREKEQKAALALSAKTNSSYLQSMTADSLIAMEFDMETGERLPLKADRVPAYIPDDIDLAGLIRLLSSHATSNKCRSAINSYYDPAIILSVQEKHSGMLSSDCSMTAFDGTSSIARWYKLTFRYLLNMTSKHIELFIQVMDINEKKNAELALVAKMTEDPLTGLLNRSTFEGRCAHEIDRASADSLIQGDCRFALVLIEIDALERVNDAYGHMFGDRMLQSVADMLYATARECESLAHLEGARFAIFSPSADTLIIRERSKIFLAALSAQFADEITTTASIGAAFYPDDADSYRTLNEHADLALYCSREAGGGRFTLYSSELEGIDRARHALTLLPAPLNDEARVRIRTFGFFDVFIAGQPIVFHHAKSKELLALLVDRRGGFVTSSEAISYLWEDEAANKVTLARYRKVAMRLRQILEQYGIADIVETSNGARRIVPEKVDCDLYSYLSGMSRYADLFKGSYMSNYSWSENTLASLM